MTSIFVQPKYHLERTSNFNTWKARLLNILEEHNLDGYVSKMEGEPTANELKTNFKNNQAKAKHIMFHSVKDNLMSMIIQPKTARECLDTLTNIFKEKSLSHPRVKKRGTCKERLCTLKRSILSS